EETVKKRLEGMEAGKIETRPETQAAAAPAPAKERKKIKLPAVNIGPYLKYAAIIAAVIFAVRVSAPLFKSLSKIRLPRPAPKVEKIVVKKQAPAPAAAPAQKISAPSKSGMVELEIKAASNNWIQVTADGEILFKGVLRKGSQERWQAKKEIWLWLSDAGGANVTVNGKDIGVLGKKDEKKSGIIIDKEGIQ
ncbi:MAG: DUF4115 domain-containing protein, partial [Candidatus Omnitrophota bacterium]